MKSLLEGLKHSIHVIKHIEVGLNLTDLSDACGVALYAEFENRQDLQIYQNHPVHLRAVEFIRKVRTERRVVDYAADAGG